jgi:hypothetical protein
LKGICEKYWESHHYKENSSYAGTDDPIRIHPGGYRDTQLLVVLYSNCPNNSLPILWSEVDGTPRAWEPLFRRHPRY